MEDEEKLKRLYEDTYSAMIKKDASELERVHDDSFVLIHMTGMHQSKKEYVTSILDGTLNYYKAVTEALDICIKGDSADLVGKSRVTAKVFGGGINTWRLRLDYSARKIGEDWKLIRAKASTY